MLAFAAIHGEFHGVAVGAAKSFVSVEKCLDEVFAAFEVVEISNGIAEGACVGDRSPY